LCYGDLAFYYFRYDTLGVFEVRHVVQQTYCK